MKVKVKMKAKEVMAVDHCGLWDSVPSMKIKVILVFRIVGVGLVTDS